MIIHAINKKVMLTAALIFTLRTGCSKNDIHANAIESLNGVVRKTTKKRKLFPSDNSAKKIVYL